MSDITRRRFQKICASLIGGLVGLVPLAAGIVFFLDPMRRKPTVPSEQTPKRDEEGYIKVTTVDAIPADQTPSKFTVVADQIDAWNYFPEQRIGKVILRKLTVGKIQTGADVSAFSDICPHLGCSVDYKPDDQEFQCPCHASAFSLAGKKSNAIPPRNLDELDVDIRDGEVWVKYLKFVIGTPEQQSLT